MKSVKIISSRCTSYYQCHETWAYTFHCATKFEPLKYSSYLPVPGKLSVDIRTQSILIFETGQVYMTTAEGCKMITITQEKCKCFCLNKTNLQLGQAYIHWNRAKHFIWLSSLISFCTVHVRATCKLL